MLKVQSSCDVTMSCVAAAGSFWQLTDITPYHKSPHTAGDCPTSLSVAKTDHQIFRTHPVAKKNLHPIWHFKKNKNNTGFQIEAFYFCFILFRKANHNDTAEAVLIQKMWHDWMKVLKIHISWGRGLMMYNLRLKTCLDITTS